MRKIFSIVLFLCLTTCVYSQITLPPTERQVLAAGTPITRLPVASTTTVATTDTVVVFRGGVWVKTTASAIGGTGTAVTVNAGSNISVNGSPNYTVTNTAPDRTVTITAGTGQSITSAYPSFTVTNTAPDQTVTINAGANISITSAYPSFTVTGTAPSYSMAIGNKITNATAGSVLFVGTNGLLQQKNSSFFYDSTNTRLSVGTLSATANLHVVSTNSTVGTYAFKVDDNAGNPLLQVRNQGQITVGQNGGDGNLFMGVSSGINNTLGVGYFNTTLGFHALATSTTGYENTVLGYNGMAVSTTSHRSVSIGSYALQSCTTGNDNTAIGHSSQKGTTTGSDNVSVGFNTLPANTTGVSNTAINLQSLFNNTTGNYNTAIGEQSGRDNVSGGQNIYIGWQSGLLALGSNNCMVGSRAGAATTGSGNTFIGNMAGFYTTGSNKLIIDNDSRTTEATETQKSLISGIFGTDSSSQSVRFAASVQVAARFHTPQGPNTAAANDLTLGNANSFIITGNTTINAIITTNWAAGDRIVLIFTGTPTVKNNTAGGAGTAKMFLAGSADFTAANNSLLGFIYDGTQWQETFRKAP